MSKDFAALVERLEKTRKELPDLNIVLYPQELTALLAALREGERDRQRLELLNAAWHRFLHALGTLSNGGAFDLTDSPKSYMGNVRRLLHEQRDFIDEDAEDYTAHLAALDALKDSK